MAVNVETDKTEGKYEIVKLQNRMPLRRGKSILIMCHSLSNRYSRTSTCISSSRSILQIILRAPL